MYGVMIMIGLMLFGWGIVGAIESKPEPTEGYYFLEVPKGDTLYYSSFVGMKTTSGGGEIINPLVLTVERNVKKAELK